MEAAGEHRSEDADLYIHHTIEIFKNKQSQYNLFNLILVSFTISSQSYNNTSSHHKNYHFSHLLT